jgi:hypothetical protein
MSKVLIVGGEDSARVQRIKKYFESFGHEVIVQPVPCNQLNGLRFDFCVIDEYEKVDKLP